VTPPVELSPAGAQRERATTCIECGGETFNHSRVCGFCLPDGHECAERRDEAMQERYS
jgi:hypothetical protein